MPSVIPSAAADPAATTLLAMVRHLLALAPLLCVTCLLSACMAGGGWQAEDRWPPKSPVHSRPGQYAVQSGDTLYSIAWRYGLDYRELADINRIGPPYKIHVGQTLKFVSEPAPDHALHQKTSVRSTGTGVAVIGGGAASARSSPSYSAMKRSASPVPNHNEKSAERPPSAPPLVWVWPTDGNVLGRFSDGARVNKGIDIGGKLGDSVHSTRSGVVVYAGSGLAGYGNLVIIKHDDVYLSAYAHNKTILVREGQTIKAGDKIAEIGSSGSAYPKLHFEIRRDGKPVDPLQLLPRR